MTTAQHAPVIAPVLPTASGLARLTPIGLSGVRLEGGLWGERRSVNREITIPHGASQLEAAGNLDNFRLAARLAGGQYVGQADDSGSPFPFLDSDVYKWLEAVGWEMESGNTDLLALADPIIELVRATQRSDGYLNTFGQLVRGGMAFRDLEWGHELYVTGHLVQAAIAWWRSVGDDRLLRVAEAAVGHVEQELGPGRREGVDGHPEIEMALVELYRTTGAERHLELARLMVERRGRGLLGPGRFGPAYWQDHLPVREARVPAGHAVRQVYLDCGVVDVAVETGDSELLDAAIQRWTAMASSWTYITGGLGSRHRDESFGDPFELPPDRAYAETCAAIGSVMLAWRLLLATGEPRFADHIERTSINGVLPGLALDGRNFFYSNPLQRRTTGADVIEGPGANRRAPWFPCACCPPNIMRFLATLPDLTATTEGDAIQLHQYASGTIRTQVNGDPIGLRVTTGYPWNGDITIEVAQSPERPVSLVLRVPAWCEGAQAVVNGTLVASSTGSGMMSLNRCWIPGDVINVELAMSTRFTSPDPRIDAIRGTVAVERGPVVYALEADDLPEPSSLEQVSVDPGMALGAAHVAAVAELHDLPAIEMAVTVADTPPFQVWPYGRRRSPIGRSTRARLVPYFAWANRSARGMRVWLPTGEERD